MSTDTGAVGRIGEAALRARLESAPPWLQERRRASWAAYRELPLPSHLRDEDWRRTDISRLRLDEYVLDLDGATAHGDALLAAQRALRDAIDPGAALVGNTRRGLRLCDGTDPLAAQGVVVSSLEEAALHHPEQLQRALSLLPPTTDAFVALWNALWRGGCFVYVPPGIEARIPIVAVTSAAGDHAGVLPATVAVVDRHASLTLVEAYLSPATSDRLLSIAATALVVADGGRLDYGLVQRWGEGTWHIARHRAGLGQGAQLRFFAATLGAGLQKAYWEVLLDGEGAEADLVGVCFASAAQHLDHQSLQHHRAPRTRSHLTLKVAVRERAHSVYSGLIAVEPEAKGADAYVQNRNLLLDRGAKADSIPRLEIKANDVRCGHGATAGHIDEEQRFYLMSRGLPQDEADELIVRGFLQDALDGCPHPGLRDAVSALLDEEIAGRSTAGVVTDAEVVA